MTKGFVEIDTLEYEQHVVYNYLTHKCRNENAFWCERLPYRGLPGFFFLCFVLLHFLSIGSRMFFGGLLLLCFSTVIIVFRFPTLPDAPNLFPLLVRPFLM